MAARGGGPLLDPVLLQNQMYLAGKLRELQKELQLVRYCMQVILGE